MERKIDLPKLWKQCTLGFAAVCFLVLVIIMKKSVLWFVLVLVIYLAANAAIFNSYFLGMMGNLYFMTRNTQKAYVYYEKAIRKNTRNIMALYNWALRLLQNGSAREALSHFQKALRLNTNIMMDKSIRLAISSCCWVTGDIDGGIEILERMIREYDYINAHVYTTLGYLYFLKDDFENAEKYSLKAVEDNPEHAAAWDNLGQICFKKGDIDKAEEHFKKALEYKDTMVDSQYYLGLIYENKADYKKAEQYYKKASECPISSLNTVSKEQIDERLEAVKNRGD